MKTSDALINLRNEIDVIDKALVALLAKRMNVVKKIKNVKIQQGLSPLDQNRWKKVVSSIVLHAARVGLDSEFVREIWNSIHQYGLKKL